MKSKLDHALELAAAGFWVFQIVPNGKNPAKRGWQAQATRVPEEVTALFSIGNFNIGISTEKFMDDQACVAVDVDMKNGKNGYKTVGDLVMDGFPFPPTRKQTTASGTEHFLYYSHAPVKGGTGALGDGVDIKSRGGYVIGAGSTIDGKAYTTTTDNVAIVPAWIYEKQAKEKVAPKKRTLNVEINQERAVARARKYLEERADSPEEGGRNEAGFRVCCEIKDLGVDEDGALELMYEWNGALESPMEDEEVQIITQSSYKTGKNEIGVKAPETMFELLDKLPEQEQIVTPTTAATKEWELNDEFALVMTGGSFQIVRDTTNHKGEKTLMRWDESAFHKYFEYAKVKVITQPANTELNIEEKSKLVSLTKMWMGDKRRRTYDGFVFSPNKPVDKRWYNLWQGFSCKPLQPGERISERGWNAFKMWTEHAFLNVCGGNEEYFKYQIGYLAHMIQRTWEKPLVACVYKGGKGVGKNAFIGRVTDLFGPHYSSTANERYVNGNFNSHMEGIVPFVLDEATWAGDKKMKGCIQDIITNPHMKIERKGFDSYVVDNFVRAFFTSNENWVVDASEDERRYFVLEVGKGRQQDLPFFEEMRVGMQDHEGCRALLTYLMQYDLTGFNVNKAPNTNAMAVQKYESLSIFGQFWFDSLKAGTWIGSSKECDAFDELLITSMSEYILQYARTRGISRQLPSATVFGREVLKFSPSTERDRVFNSGYKYKFPGLAKLREEFDAHLGGKTDWDNKQEELKCLQ